MTQKEKMTKLRIRMLSGFSGGGSLRLPACSTALDGAVTSITLTPSGPARAALYSSIVGIVSTHVVDGNELKLGLMKLWMSAQMGDR